MVPYVIEKTHRGDSVFDLYSRLLKDRIIMLGEAIDDHVANSIIGQMLFLDSEDSTKEIKLYINSPGGVVTAGLAIYDTMQHIKAPVETICVGQAASMAAVLLASGAKGKRKALPHARIMIHQVSGGAYGQSTDVEIQAKEIAELKKSLTAIVAGRSNQSYDKVHKDMERDFYMSAEQAKEYGLVDSVFKNK